MHIYSPVKTNQIKEIMKEVDDHTLVVWDVDGVLLIGKDRIFHSQNIHSGLNEQYVNDIADKYGLTFAQRHKLTSQLLKQRSIQLVDNELPGIIEDLKTRNIKTIALTQFAVGPFGIISRVEDWRIGELSQLGIKFDSAFKGLNKIELQDLGKLNVYHPLYKQGILFCNRHDKGSVLGAFLDVIEWKPNKIVFIDDKKESLEAVEVELKRRNIDFIGLYYTVALDFPSEIDDRVVKLQFEYAMQHGIWLNDQMALEKLN